MKQKPTKRSSSNKQQQNNSSSQPQTRRLSNSSLDAHTRSSYKANVTTTNGGVDSNTSSCKASLLSKGQKALKRDLLRCSDRRPSLLGSQTLQTPRARHESQQPQPSTSSSLPIKQPQRRRSLSADPHLRHTTNDRIGPWPDLTTVRVASAGIEFLNPIKAGRTMKNPRVFSPKYGGTLSDNVSKFQYHTSPRAYIDEYRKQKGYQRDGRSSPKVILQVLPTELSDDEQLSTTDIVNGGSDQNTETTAEPMIASTSERLTASTTDLSSRQNLQMKSTQSFVDHVNIPPTISALTKASNETHHISNLSAIAFRNGHLRSIRHPHPHYHHQHHHQQQQHYLAQHFPQQQQQTFFLPPLNTSSFQYVNGMNSADRIYAHSKKPSIQNQSKFFLLEGRGTKSHLSKTRNPQRINSDSEVVSRSQDYSDLRANGGPAMTTTQRTTALIAYQLPRLPPAVVTSQSDLR